MAEDMDMRSISSSECSQNPTSSLMVARDLTVEVLGDYMHADPELSADLDRQCVAPPPPYEAIAIPCTALENVPASATDTAVPVNACDRTSGEAEEHDGRSNDPTVFSSTPDLASKCPSPDSESATQGLRTPPEDDFITTLDKKLLALVQDDQNHLQRPHFDLASLSKEHSQFESYVSSRPSYSQLASIISTTLQSPQFLQQAKSGDVSLKRKRSTLSGHRALSVRINESKAHEARGPDSDKQSSPSSEDVPASKKVKSIKTETSFSYAVKECASLRRARSLTALSTNRSLAESTDAIPTVIVSPSSDCSYTDTHDVEDIVTTNVQNVKKKIKSCVPAVPIIAPPPFEIIPSAPRSPDDAAEARLRILLDKEKASRYIDGFEHGVNECFDEVTQEEVNKLLGIEEDLRRVVVAWILTITPSKKMRMPHIREHLRKCPETRFHAIMLFGRYFSRIGSAMPLAGKQETHLMKRGRQRIVWEVAMSCLALAIKFNRDFLYPLTPIYSRSLLAVAPHTMSHDDLEISQKDVLEVLSYQVREVTPGPFMEEIWHSLPTFRRLLAFPEGWSLAQQNAWRRLNACVTECEMFQFPISLLTACALIEGTHETLTSYYDAEPEGQLSDMEEALCDRADEAIAGIVEDVKDLLSVSKKDLDRCRVWIMQRMEL